MEMFGIAPKSYEDSVIIFDKERPIKFDSKLTADEISDIFQGSLSPNQIGLLYSFIKKLQGKNYTIKDIIDSLLTSDSQSKWSIISTLESLEKTKIFSTNPTKPEEIVKPGKISIIDLKEMPQNIQQIIVMKLAKELFEARKRNIIPEFIFVLEEGHNFCPERSFGETPSSKIIRTMASEGRKFGLSICVISQRPAKIDKNVLSQCNTQIILKVTNPNDLRTILDSLEGVTESTKEEIKNLPIGVCLLVGVTESPLIVDVRVRRSEHGGEVIKTEKVGKRILTFAPKISEDDIKKCYKSIAGVDLINYPLWKVKGVYEDSDITIFFDGLSGELIYQFGKRIEQTNYLRDLLNLTQKQREIIMYLMKENVSDTKNISKALGLSMDDIKNEMKILMSKNYVVAEGDLFKINIIPIDLKKLFIESDLVPVEEGIKIDAKITSEIVRSIAEMLGLKVKEIETVYFPYWSVLTYKNRRFLINALDKRLDLNKSKIISDFV
jgi:hypothetical protein